MFALSVYSRQSKLKILHSPCRHKMDGSVLSKWERLAQVVGSIGSSPIYGITGLLITFLQ